MPHAAAGVKSEGKLSPVPQWPSSDGSGLAVAGMAAVAGSSEPVLSGVPGIPGIGAELAASDAFVRMATGAVAAEDDDDEDNEEYD